jgi:hypothetical protein
MRLKIKNFTLIKSNNPEITSDYLDHYQQAFDRG